MVEATLYFYFLGLGAAGGVATVVFVSLAIWNRMKNKPIKKKKGIV